MKRTMKPLAMSAHGCRVHSAASTLNYGLVGRGCHGEKGAAMCPDQNVICGDEKRKINS